MKKYKGVIPAQAGIRKQKRTGSRFFQIPAVLACFACAAGMTMWLFGFPAFAQNPETVCKLLTRHEAAADVAYQPGVDVHGRPVTPADIHAAPVIVPDVVRIPLSVDLAQGMQPYLPEGTELNAHFGMIEIYRDGSVVFNGQNLTDAAQVMCGMKEKPAVSPAPAAEPPVSLAPAVSAEKKKDDEGELIWGEGH